MGDLKLPRGVVPLAAEGISLELLSGRDYAMWPDADEALARAALTRAWPLIEKAVLRDAAKRILLLDLDDRERHRRASSPPWNDIRTSLRRLARGEPLPDVPEKEESGD